MNDLREQLRDAVTERRDALPPSPVPWRELRRRRSGARRARAAGGAVLAAAAVAGLVALLGLPGDPAPPAGPATTAEPEVTAPLLVGLSAEEAEQRLQALRVPYVISYGTSQPGPGRVLTQRPAAGTALPPGGSVVVTVGVGTGALPVLPDDEYRVLYTGRRVTARHVGSGCGEVFIDMDDPGNTSLGGSELSYNTPPCNDYTGPVLQTGSGQVASAGAGAGPGACVRAASVVVGGRDVPLRAGDVLCGLADDRQPLVWRMRVVSVRGGTSVLELSAWTAP